MLGAIRTGKWELVIIWETGDIDKDIYEYETKEEAEKAMNGMRMAFGKQISWSCVRPQYVK